MAHLTLLCAALVGGASAFQCGDLMPCLRMARASSGSAGVRMQAAGKGKLLVLGGTGFVGSTVTKLALDRGYEVVSLSRRGQPPTGSSLAGQPKVKWVQGDATKAGCNFPKVIIFSNIRRH
jgi:predicted alpha/beta hydrolase